MKVFAYPHTHWDREWYQPFEEFRLRLIEVMDKLIDDLSSGKLEYFYFDGQTAAIEDYLEIFPEKKDKIKKLIKEGKLSFGPWYILSDEFLVNGESFMRNLLLGINQSREFGCNNFIGYLPDSFGHIASMPMILNSFGIKDGVLWRGAGDEKSLFKWKSKDGSRLLVTYLIEGYFQDIFNKNWTIEKKEEEIKSFLDKIKHHTTLNSILLPIGADHLATAVDLNDQVDKISSLLVDYDIKISSINEYLENIDYQENELIVREGELRDNSRNFILPGTFSTRLYLKQHNSKSDWLLRKAEKLNTLLEHVGLTDSRKNQLDYAWKLLLQNHPHDSICGCSEDSVHREMITRYEKINQVSKGIIKRCLRDLSLKISKDNIVVMNLCDYEYSGVIKVLSDKEIHKNMIAQKIRTVYGFSDEILYDIQNIPVQEDYIEQYEYLVWVESLKPYSINTINSKTKIKFPQKTEISINYIQNRLIKLTVNNNGSIDIKDLVENKTFSNIHLLEDRADIGDTYNFAPLENDVPQQAKLLKTEIEEEGFLRSILRLHYEIAIPKNTNEEKRSDEIVKHIITTDIILYAETKRIEFETNWKNISKDHILQLKFNLPEKIYKTISEDHFGLIERDFDPDYSLGDNIPVEFKKELKTNTACMQRFFWSQGLGLITEGLVEYGIDGNQLYLTLLRSIGTLSKGQISTRGLAAGPQIPTPEAQCLGKQTARYALYITEEPKDLFRQADFFMGNTVSQQGFSEIDLLKSNQILGVENSNIYIYSVKSPFDKNKKGIVLRMVNLSKEQQIINLSSIVNKSIYELNSLEEKGSERNFIDSEIVFKPYELKTLWLL